MRLTTEVMLFCVRFNMISAVSAHCTRGHENYSHWLWGKNWNFRHRVLVNTCTHMNETEGTAGGFAERQAQVSRALVRIPGITEVDREISASSTQFRDCDYIRGVRRRSMIIYIQCRSLIMGETDLNIISVRKQW